MFWLSVCLCGACFSNVSVHHFWNLYHKAILYDHKNSYLVVVFSSKCLIVYKMQIIDGVPSCKVDFGVHFSFFLSTITHLIEMYAGVEARYRKWKSRNTAEGNKFISCLTIIFCYPIYLLNYIPIVIFVLIDINNVSSLSIPPRGISVSSLEIFHSCLVSLSGLSGPKIKDRHASQTIE